MFKALDKVRIVSQQSQVKVLTSLIFTSDLLLDGLVSRGLPRGQESILPLEVESWGLSTAKAWSLEKYATLGSMLMPPSSSTPSVKMPGVNCMTIAWSLKKYACLGSMLLPCLLLGSSSFPRSPGMPPLLPLPLPPPSPFTWPGGSCPDV